MNHCMLVMLWERSRDESLYASYALGKKVEMNYCMLVMFWERRLR